MKIDRSRRKGNAKVITTELEPVPPPVEKGSRHIDSRKMIYKILLYKFSPIGRDIGKE